jgi:hypothetical protein
MKKRIVILVHEKTKPADTRSYFIAQLARCWQEAGFQVASMAGPSRSVSGDLLFMHVDLSRVPDPCFDPVARFPATVNAAVRDIRKSAISRHLVGPRSDWDGPVIVKTDLNSAGLAEKHYNGSRGPGHPPGFRTSADYRVYPHITKVPAEFFENPWLIVEKFLPETSNGEYCTRSYNFLGDAEDCFAVYSDLPVVRIGTKTRMETTEVHPQIRELRQALGFDYGKFDYVVRDGQAVLLDANKTPGYLPISDEDTKALVYRRARGIYSFLR